MSTNRAIVHMDLDAFFVAVEVLRNKALAGLPLIIGGRGDRGVVASCSYEARRFGVRSAMPVRMALRLCPQAKVISGDMEAYSQYSKLITEIIADRSPLFEKASIDEFYIDVSGMDRFFGTYTWASELRRYIIKESGLPISMGLSTNKMVSKVATGESKPNGQKQVERGLESHFLDPLPIEKLPMAGQKTTETLHHMGVYKVHTLRQIPKELLVSLFGKNGLALWHKAHGRDNSPVTPYYEQKSISTENTFQQDSTSPALMRAVITRMVEELGFKLREQQKLCSTITVKLRYSNFDTVTRQLRIPYTSSDHQLIKVALELFEKLFERRLLVRLVGVRLSGLVNGNYQIHLFEDSAEDINLYQAMDHIRTKFGKDKIARASGSHVREFLKAHTGTQLTRLKYDKK